MRDSLKLKFFRLLLQIDSSNPYQIIFNGSEWSGPNEDILVMIKRFFNDKPAILPYKNGNKSISWLLFTDQDNLLGKSVLELDKFLLPYYVTPLGNGMRQYFTQQKEMAKIGYQLFPKGYYGYTSDISYEKEIWKLVRLWAKLDDRRPSIDYEEIEINAFTLRNRFHQAIALQKWEEAKEALIELQQGRYLNDENFKFLTIQWLSSQGKWRNIWESEDFEVLAGLGTIPNQVHLALLKAFYQKILSKTDILGRYDKTFEVFKEYRSKLGTLLRSQLRLDEDFAIRVFAYDSADRGQLEKLERYLEITDDDLTKDIIEYLILFVKTNNIEELMPSETALSNLEKAQLRFADKQYEDAFILLENCELSVEKVRLLTGIAMMEETEETSTFAFKHYKKLSVVQQQELKEEPISKGWVIYLLGRQYGNSVLIDEQNSERLMKLNWTEWFQAFVDNSNLDSLEEYLTLMDTSQGNIVKTITSLSRLSESIVTVGMESLSLGQRMLLQTALPMFITELLRDERFPNEKASDVYEYTRETLDTHGKRNEFNTGFLIRLTEGLLRLDISKVELYWTKVEVWFQVPPTVRLSPYVLEVLEMFKEYGVRSHLRCRLFCQRH